MFRLPLLLSGMPGRTGYSTADSGILCFACWFPLSGAVGTDEPSQYFDALKYWVTLDGAKYIFTVAYDMTELYQEDMFNLQNALTDSLTGAQNRRYGYDPFGR